MIKIEMNGKFQFLKAYVELYTLMSTHNNTKKINYSPSTFITYKHLESSWH